MSNETFNKIGKIVAVSIGIVLMGAVFASTKAETTDNVIECSGNEIKTDTSIEKGECEDGKRRVCGNTTIKTAIYKKRLLGKMAK